MKVSILNLFVNGRHGVQHHVYRPQFKRRLLKLEVISGDICESSTTAPFGRHFGFVTQNHQAVVGGEIGNITQRETNDGNCLKKLV